MTKKLRWRIFREKYIFKNYLFYLIWKILFWLLSIWLIQCCQRHFIHNFENSCSISRVYFDEIHIRWSNLLCYRKSIQNEWDNELDDHLFDPYRSIGSLVYSLFRNAIKSQVKTLEQCANIQILINCWVNDLWIIFNSWCSLLLRYRNSSTEFVAVIIRSTTVPSSLHQNIRQTCLWIWLAFNVKHQLSKINKEKKPDYSHFIFLFIIIIIVFLIFAFSST